MLLNVTAMFLNLSKVVQQIRAYPFQGAEERLLICASRCDLYTLIFHDFPGPTLTPIVNN